MPQIHMLTPVNSFSSSKKPNTKIARERGFRRKILHQAKFHTLHILLLSLSIPSSSSYSSFHFLQQMVTWTYSVGRGLCLHGQGHSHVRARKVNRERQLLFQMSHLNSSVSRKQVAQIVTQQKSLVDPGFGGG